jgi:hypothetical protein
VGTPQLNTAGCVEAAPCKVCCLYVHGPGSALHCRCAACLHLVSRICLKSPVDMYIRRSCRCGQLLTSSSLSAAPSLLPPATVECNPCAKQTVTAAAWCFAECAMHHFSFCGREQKHLALACCDIIGWQQPSVTLFGLALLLKPWLASCKNTGACHHDVNRTLLRCSF